jgi:hypothetical protein
VSRIASARSDFKPDAAPCPGDDPGVALQALCGDPTSPIYLEESVVARTSVAAGNTSARRTRLWIATRKGIWTLSGDAARNGWQLAGPHYLGHTVHHVVADPRDRRSVLAAARTGHLGPTVFRSADNGATWEGVNGFNLHPQRKAWCGGDQDGTPDGPKLHSILVDPRDASHLYIGMSGGGVFESTDGGADWRPLNKGVRADFMPDPAPEYGHDPHCLRFAGGNPDRLYQQNHCGIYRLDRPGDVWQDIGAAMPKSVGDVGFPLAVHPREPESLWVLPMDGTTVWPRTSPAGRPAVYRSRDGGKSWKRQDQGLPRSQAWWTVKRQAMTSDHRDPTGIYFGTTSGEVWGSRDEGRSFRCLARHLPEIYAVEAAQA